MFSCSKELVLSLPATEGAVKRVRDACAGHDMRKQRFVLEFDLLPALEQTLLMHQSPSLQIVASLFRTKHGRESEYGRRLVDSRLVEICSALRGDAELALIAMLDFYPALVLRMEKLPRNGSVELQQKFAACLVWERDTFTVEEREFLQSMEENMPCCLSVLWWTKHTQGVLLNNNSTLPKEDFVTALWRQAMCNSSVPLPIKPLLTMRNTMSDSKALLEWVVAQEPQQGEVTEDADMLLFQCQTELPTLNVAKCGVELCAALACAPNTNLCLLMLPTVILPLYYSRDKDSSRFALAALIACTRTNNTVGRRLLTLWMQDLQSVTVALRQQHDSCAQVELVFNLTHSCFEAIHQLIQVDAIVDLLLENISNGKALQCLSACVLSKHHATLQRLITSQELAKICTQPNKSKQAWGFLQALAFALPNAMKHTMLQRTDITWERLVVMEGMPFWSNLLVDSSGALDAGGIVLISAMLTLLASENQPENESVAIGFLANLTAAGGELNVFKVRILNDIRLVNIIQRALQQRNSIALRCVSNLADDHSNRTKLRGLFAALIDDFPEHEQRAQDLLRKLR